MKCPKCKFENAAEMRFCGKCGQSLSEPASPAPKDLSFDEKLDKIQRYLPRGLSEKERLSALQRISLTAHVPPACHDSYNMVFL